LKPLDIVLVHGGGQKCTDLSKKIMENFKASVNKVWTPANIEPVLLNFEKRNVA